MLNRPNKQKSLIESFNKINEKQEFSISKRNEDIATCLHMLSLINNFDIDISYFLNSNNPRSIIYLYLNVAPTIDLTQALDLEDDFYAMGKALAKIAILLMNKDDILNEFNKKQCPAASITEIRQDLQTANMVLQAFTPKVKALIPVAKNDSFFANSEKSQEKNTEKKQDTGNCTIM